MTALSYWCPICKSTDKLLRCQGCMVMPYCGREHQIADRKDHKKACNAIKKSQELLQTEERALRAAPADFMMPENVFVNGVGNFWGILETRDYMRARFGLVDSLLKIKNYFAVKAAFDHMMDMFRLCRSDNMGLRFMAPALFIRLGMDQGCYDFLKWWSTTGSRNDYDWGNMNEPFLDVRDADVFEAVNLFIGKYADLGHAVPLILIKMKLLRDLKTLQNSNFLYQKLPTEMVDRIRKLAVGEIVANRKDILMNNNQKPLIEKLEKQMQQLFQFVKKSNRYFWPGLLDPADYLAAAPSTYSEGSKEHAGLTIQFYYDAFVETPGSIETIREMVREMDD